jgi:hypothetical protein
MAAFIRGGARTALLLHLGVFVCLSVHIDFHAEVSMSAVVYLGYDFFTALGTPKGLK